MKKEQYLINSSFNEISSVSTKARSFLENNSINQETINAVDISLVEALNNIVEHSYKMQTGNRIEVEVKVASSEIIIKLCDWGNARTNLQKAKLNFDPNDIDNLPEGGMGLFIIEKLMDSTKYYSQDGKNTYIIIKSF